MSRDSKAMPSDVEWIRWGKQDPLWSVATWKDKHKGAAGGWTDEEFFANGADHWERCEKAWRRYGVNFDTACLEVGCGAGRMTRVLAAAFRAVEAVDVSEDMIAYAKKHVTAGNVQFYRAEGRVIPLPAASVGAVFSTYVFQHFDQMTDGLAYFDALYDVLQPAGSLMVQLPIYHWPEDFGGRLDQPTRAVLSATFGGRVAITQLLARYKRWRDKGLMRGTHYDAQALHSRLQQRGYTDIEIMLYGALGASWVFARKPA